MYTQENPHPDIRYVETKEWTTSDGKAAKTVWYQCIKCGKYQHSLKHFHWMCAHCQDEPWFIETERNKLGT